MVLFDALGPPLAEILANCEAETGLPAPKVPA
jgi:N-methylhydantoinase B